MGEEEALINRRSLQHTSVKSYCSSNIVPVCCLFVSRHSFKCVYINSSISAEIKLSHPFRGVVFRDPAQPQW